MTGEEEPAKKHEKSILRGRRRQKEEWSHCRQRRVVSSINSVDQSTTAEYEKIQLVWTSGMLEILREVGQRWNRI